MRRISLILVLTMIMISTANAQDFYDIDTVNEIEITFAESNWDEILDNYYQADQGERLVGTAVINGVQFDSVGVRYKGNSSYSVNRVKNGLNIKLDYIIDDQEIDNYGTLKLANGFMDPSFVREALSYEIARKYMPAGQANYINVTINGSLIGLYTNTQDVDKYFMRTHFDDGEGVRFKGIYDSPGGGVTVWGYFGEDSSSYSSYYQLESDSGWSELIDFLDTLNNTPSVVDQVLNLDRHLWMLAYDILLVNLDAPINMVHNYYIYRDNSNRFNPIVWDLNMAFGGFTNVVGGGGHDDQLSVTEMQELTPLFNLNNSNFPKISNILTNSTYQKMFIAHMKTMMEENFSNGWYETRALEMQAIIDDDVQADPNKFYTYNDFINNIDNSVGGGGPGGGGVVGLTELMDGRVSYLSSHSLFTATAPSITSVTHSPEEADAYATITVTAEVSDASTIQLAYRDNAIEEFTKIDMYDDGAHGDGSSGDGVYGVSITVGTADVQYYIYAENSNAAYFSPERAEYEFYTIPVNLEIGDIVINEFMADNDNIQPDQDGEYDDWIELYNNGAAAISLSGYYLSDDPTDPTKWTFPDTSIEAGGYLIIWADEDTDQAGLHADFKLSASGEDIVLSDPSETVWDEVTFGEQTTDISTGRYPNGTGDFITMTPTFGAENINSTTINVVINELMADNDTTQPDQDDEYEDWIELYNNGTEAVSLDGYYLSDDPTEPTKWAFPDTSIEAGGYLVIWADEDTSQAGLHAYFKLSASGESVVFSDPSETVLDEVTFGEQTTDISYGRYPNGTGDFVTMPPTIGAVNTVAIESDVVINEFMADNDSTQADQDDEYDDWIELYNNGSSAVSLAGYYLSDDPSTPTQWVFPDTFIAAGGYLIIWADSDTEQVGLHADFKLSASGESIVFSDPSETVLDEVTFGEQTTDVSTGRYPNGTGDFISMTPTFGAENINTVVISVVINEFMADNDTTQADQDDEYDDWIELYNNGSEAVSLEGYYLSDDPATPTLWALPDITIEAGGYLVVWADDDTDQEGLHADFKLSASGESVVFADPAGVILDEVTFGEQTTDVSYGRYPNGTGDFISMTPTFGAENINTVVISVVINEFMADNDTTQADQDDEYDDWIELYNNGSEAVSLEGYYLSDDPATPTLWALPDITIEAGGYLVVWADDDTDQEGLHANFKLSASGESVVFADPAGVILDEVTFGEQTTDVSYGRYPNGTGDFVTMPPTFGAANTIAVGSDVVINEFMADNDTVQPDQDDEYDDWIELYNNSSSVISLNGWYLSDDPTEPTKWEFPDTSIEENGYLIIWADDDTEQAGLHADFKLSASGESVVLSDMSQTVLDEVTFGEQTTDISYGRYPNGTGDFISMIPTFAAENTNESSSYAYLPGDANMAAESWPPQTIGGDVTYLVNYFRGIADPCLMDGFYCSADATGDCMVVGGDVTYLVNYFRGLTELSYCSDYPPTWLEAGDIPDDQPADWPGCDTVEQ